MRYCSLHNSILLSKPIKSLSYCWRQGPIQIIKTKPESAFGDYLNRWLQEKFLITSALIQMYDFKMISRPTKGGLTTNRAGVGILLLVVGSVIVRGVKKTIWRKEN